MLYGIVMRSMVSAVSLVRMGLVPCQAEQKAERAEFRMKTLPGGQVRVPRYHYGWLPFLHWPGSGSPHFSVLDPVADRLVSQITIEVPEAKEVYGVDLAVFPDRRRFAVTATTKNLNDTRSSWLLIYTAEGQMTHREKITPIYSRHIAVAPDNTIWGWGYNVRTVEDRNSADPVLYRWSETGKLLQQLLKRKDFAEDDTPGEPDVKLGLSCMAVSRSRVVLYAPGSGVLAELSNSGEVIGMYKPARPLRNNGEPESIGGMAVTDGGEIYASFGTIHRFDRASRAWTPVEQPEALAVRSRIYGSAGNQILLSGASGDRFHFRLVTLK
ncbi:MAG: hypothetical protein KatS3mg005_1573 [Bryobacteraceae bacterium]|nr:MAG: hypothetical protein KatS3mg005_1573 [Bryobacteraceae bacterium]